MTAEETREPRKQHSWGLAFPEAKKAGPCGPGSRSRAPTASRENPRGSPLQARGGPFPLRPLEANHTKLLELPKGPSHRCCNSGRFPTYPSPLHRKHESPTHIQRSPVSASCSRGGILSLRGRARIPGIPVASQEQALSTGKARGTPGSCHHSQSLPDVSVHSRETCFPFTAWTFKPRIDSHQGGTWDSPVGKPHGKASWESLEGKPQIPCSTRREA